MRHCLALFLLGSLFMAAAAGPGLGQGEGAPVVATINADVDVYDAPNGQGNILGFVNKHSTVETWPDDCVDGWCPIAGEGVPRGFGWLWGAFLDAQ